MPPTIPFIPFIDPNQGLGGIAWPADLQPTEDEQQQLYMAWVWYVNLGNNPSAAPEGQQPPVMPEDWAGGRARWDRQLALVEQAAQQSRDAIRSAGGAPPGEGGRRLLKTVLLLAATGAAAWWWFTRRRR